VGFDGVEPAGPDRCPYGLDVQAPEQRHEGGWSWPLCRSMMTSNWRRDSKPKPSKGFAHVDDCSRRRNRLLSSRHRHRRNRGTARCLGADGRSPASVEVADDEPRPGRPACAVRVALPVEADYRRPLRTSAVELPDASCFRSNAGSSEVIHIRMR
jgi:hypothetical protein